MASGRRSRRWRALLAGTASTAMVATMSITAVATTAAPAQAAGSDPVSITLTGDDVTAAAGNVNGLTFKGFGVLSANSTSALLMDYKAQRPGEYWELIETLFGGDHPIMNTIKIEMGNDRNTSTGPNAATMRSRDEYPNVLREPGFQLAADAEKVARDDVHVSILRWNRPAWVASDTDQYIWFKNTVIAAYREYGFMVDSINPDTNETGNPNQQLYKDFSSWVANDAKGYEGATSADPNNGFVDDTEEALFHSIQTVAADTVGTPSVAFGDAMTKAGDSSLRDAVDIVGFHYSNADDKDGNLTKIAEDLDKEIWNSEGQATFSNSADRPNNNTDDEAGGSGTQFGGVNSALEMANWVTTGFDDSRRTLTIFQPAIGSFYDGLQYSSKELVSARDPWSGWIYYDGGLAVVQQFTQFARLGWENEDNTAGIWRGIPQASGSDLGGGNPPSGARAGNASYTTLAAPDASDFSTVIVNDSAFTKTYSIAAEDLALGDDPTMEIWETRAADKGQAYGANYVRPVREIQPDGEDVYTVTVAPWSAVTATTLDHAVMDVGDSLTARQGYGNVLPSSPEYTSDEDGRDVLDTDSTGHVNGVTDDDTLYADDFDYTGLPSIQTYDPVTGGLMDSGESFLDSRGALAKPEGTPDVDEEDNGATPLYSNDTNGAFESVATADPGHGRVLRQQIGAGLVGGAWNGGDPKTTIGDFRWANYTVSVDVLFEEGSGRYASIGAREQGGTSNGQNVSAAELKIDPAGAWTFMRYGATLASGTVSDTAGTDFRTGSDAWNTLSVRVAGDTYTALVNGVEIASYTDPAPQAAGRIQLGSGFTFTQFDNLRVKTIDGYTPYYTDVIDGMHQTSWDDTAVSVLEFDDAWSHANGQGMYEWQRTASKSTAQGASLTYTFTGTGLDILGSNGGSATLDATVDGVRIAAGAPTFASGSERTTYMLRGLADGKHTVSLSTANDGVLNVDAVGVVTANANSAGVDTTILSEAVDAAQGLEADDYHPESWGVFDAAREAAAAAVADPVAYGLDAEGAAALASRLSAAQDNLVGRDVSPEILSLGLVAAVSSGSEPPSSIGIDGGEAAVTWNKDTAATLEAADDYTTASLGGITAGPLEDGLRHRFTADVEVLPTLDMVWYIDSGAGETSPQYAAVRDAVPGLGNEVADQKAGDWGYGPNTVIKTGTDLADKFSTGLYQNGKTLTYTLPMEAGTYRLTSGFTEWWSGENRPMAQKVTWTDASGTERSVTGTKIASIGTAGRTATGTVDFTLDSDATVTYSTVSDGGKDPVISWLGVARVPRTAEIGVLAQTVGQALPGTVSVDGEDIAVTWDADTILAASSAKAYDTVQARGTAGAAATEDASDRAAVGNSEEPVLIEATLEMLPDRPVYYIDSGTDGVSSPQYVAVAAAVPDLLNDKADQVLSADGSDAGQWGYIADGMRVKSSTDLADKYSTGLYQDTTKLIYRLPLETGTYTLTGGFTEWWGMNRTMYHTVNVDGEELAKGTIALSGSSTPLTGDLTFTLAEPATVDYVVTNEGAGGEKPVIAWLAVAAHPDKSGLQSAVDEAQGLSEADFTSASWAPFAAALDAARDVLADAGAGDTAIAQAMSALGTARSGLVSVAVLRQAVALAETLRQEDYTAESWTPFARALADARTVLADGEATRTRIDEAATGLLAAQRALAEPSAPVDTTILEAAVRLASHLAEADHASGSWAPFAAALAAAQQVLADDQATQEQVDAATTGLLDAQGRLVSTEALAASVRAAGVVREESYTPGTWAPFARALQQARTVLADGGATQEQVDAAQAALSDALDRLKEPVSSEALQALADSAGRFDAADYTPESWAPFAAALAAARQVLADGQATQSEVDAATGALASARDALVESGSIPIPGDVDTTALRAAIASAEPLAESEFTSESWAPFARALADARAVLADGAATQPQVDAATKALITSQGALVTAEDATIDDSAGVRSASGSTSSGLSATGSDARTLGLLAVLAAAAGAGLLMSRRQARP
jgi:hypothetical protein